MLYKFAELYRHWDWLVEVLIICIDLQDYIYNKAYKIKIIKIKI